MNPKSAPWEAWKKTSQARLETRRAFLKEKGLSEEAIRKDVKIRKLKADVRKSDFRMASIAAQEEISRQVAKAKADKLASAKAPDIVSSEEIPAKKDKKGKKERAEKQTEAGAKREKPPKKTEPSPVQ